VTRDGRRGLELGVRGNQARADGRLVELEPADHANRVDALISAVAYEIGRCVLGEVAVLMSPEWIAMPTPKWIAH
jgi:hypothetical protein